MDFDNVAELVKGMQEYLESHDIRKADAWQLLADERRIGRKKHRDIIGALP